MPTPKPQQLWSEEVNGREVRREIPIPSSGIKPKTLITVVERASINIIDARVSGVRVDADGQGWLVITGRRAL